MIFALIGLFILVVCSAELQAQEKQKAIFPTQVFAEEVGYLKVSVCYQDGVYRSYPCARLGADEPIRIDFDLLDDVPRSLFYTLEHCTYDWNPSEVDALEAYRGMTPVWINTSQPSYSTLVSYRSYSILLGKDVTPLISGNWLIRVFDSSDRENPILQAAFSLWEEDIHVLGVVDSKTPDGDFSFYQNVDCTLSPLRENKGLSMTNSYSVIVGQNGSSYRYKVLRDPSFISSLSMEYKGHNGATFFGGNEFFALEVLTDQYNGMGVEHSWTEDHTKHLALFADNVLPSRSYVERRDANGRHIVRNTDLSDYATTTDYYNVLFTVHTSNTEAESIILEGEAFDPLPRRFKELRYDHSLGAYIGSVLVKGGYIGYRYTDKEYGSNAIMGDYYQTENEYTIFVYEQRLGDKYDRLSGIGRCTSSMNSNF